MNLLELFKERLKEYLPGISIDCVIFGYHEGTIQVLTLKMKKMNSYLLPGGFIKKHENLEEAAYRVVKERSGVDNVFLQQFHTFGDVTRNTFENVEMIEKDWPDESIIQFFKNRFISVGYFSVVKKNSVKPEIDLFSESFEWKSLDSLDDLMLDHKHIVETAIEALQNNVSLLEIGDKLLPQKFTFPELQQLFETILRKKLDRGNFQKKILKSGVLNRHNKAMRGGAHKSPYLYSFNKKNMQKIVDDKIA